MQFRMKPAPFQRSTKLSTKRIMLELSIVLAIVWIYAIVFNFVNVGVKNGVSAILIGVISVVVSVLCDLVVALISKVKGKDLLNHLIGSYSYVTGLVFALCLPVNTSIFVVVCGAIFGTVVGKLVFGGFGHNIVNPAGIGRIFVGLTFALGVTPSAVDGFSGATITGQINWLTGYIPNGYTLTDLLLGQYVGAMGETCVPLLLACGIYLVVRKIIDYRLVGSYLLTAFLIALGYGLLFKVDYVLTYALTHMFVGGLLFGAIFMLTDPVTTPTSQMGKMIFGIGAAMLAMLIRVCGNLPEGVVFALVLMNLFTPLIDSTIKGKTTDKVVVRWVIVAAGIVLAVLVNIGFGLLMI